MHEVKQRETIESIFNEIVKRLESGSSPHFCKKIRKRETRKYQYIELSQYEYFFRLYLNKDTSNLTYSVRVNLINDMEGKTWKNIFIDYLSIEDSVPISKYITPLYDFIDELVHQTFAWEGSPRKYWDGKYFIMSCLYALPDWAAADHKLTFAKKQQDIRSSGAYKWSQTIPLNEKWLKSL